MIGIGDPLLADPSTEAGFLDGTSPKTGKSLEVKRHLGPLQAEARKQVVEALANLLVAFVQARPRRGGARARKGTDGQGRREGRMARAGMSATRLDRVAPQR